MTATLHKPTSFAPLDGARRRGARRHLFFLGSTTVLMAVIASTSLVNEWQRWPAVAGVIFMSLVSIDAGRLLRLPDPILRVETEGITDRRLGPRLIPWQAIRKITVKRQWSYGIDITWIE